MLTNPGVFGCVEINGRVFINLFFPETAEMATSFSPNATSPTQSDSVDIILGVFEVPNPIRMVPCPESQHKWHNLPGQIAHGQKRKLTL